MSRSDKNTFHISETLFNKLLLKYWIQSFSWFALLPSPGASTCEGWCSGKIDDMIGWLSNILISQVNLLVEKQDRCSASEYLTIKMSFNFRHLERRPQRDHCHTWFSVINVNYLQRRNWLTTLLKWKVKVGGICWQP